MENFKDEQILDNETSNSNLNYNSIELLIKTARWTKFISILGFIFSGIIAIFSFALLFIGDYAPPGFPNIGFIPFLIYFVMAVISFFPNLYLFNFSVCIKNLNKNDIEIDKAFKWQHKFWQFLGIITIIYLSLIVLGFLFAFLGIMLS